MDADTVLRNLKAKDGVSHLLGALQLRSQILDQEFRESLLLPVIKLNSEGAQSRSFFAPGFGHDAIAGLQLPTIGCLLHDQTAVGPRIVAAVTQHLLCNPLNRLSCELVEVLSHLSTSPCGAQLIAGSSLLPNLQTGLVNIPSQKSDQEQNRHAANKLLCDLRESVTVPETDFSAPTSLTSLLDWLCVTTCSPSPDFCFHSFVTLCNLTQDTSATCIIMQHRVSVLVIWQVYLHCLSFLQRKSPLPDNAGDQKQQTDTHVFNLLGDALAGPRDIVNGCTIVHASKLSQHEWFQSIFSVSLAALANICRCNVHISNESPSTGNGSRETDENATDQFVGEKGLSNSANSAATSLVSQETVNEQSSVTCQGQPEIEPSDDVDMVVAACRDCATVAICPVQDKRGIAMKSQRWRCSTQSVRIQLFRMAMYRQACAAAIRSAVQSPHTSSSDLHSCISAVQSAHPLVPWQSAYVDVSDAETCISFSSGWSSQAEKSMHSLSTSAMYGSHITVDCWAHLFLVQHGIMHTSTLIISAASCYLVGGQLDQAHCGLITTSNVGRSIQILSSCCEQFASHHWSTKSLSVDSNAKRPILAQKQHLNQQHQVSPLESLVRMLRQTVNLGDTSFGPVIQVISTCRNLCALSNFLPALASTCSPVGGVLTLHDDCWGQNLRCARSHITMLSPVLIPCLVCLFRCTWMASLPGSQVRELPKPYIQLSMIGVHSSLVATQAVSEVVSGLKGQSIQMICSTWDEPVDRNLQSRVRLVGPSSTMFWCPSMQDISLSSILLMREQVDWGCGLVWSGLPSSSCPSGVRLLSVRSIISVLSSWSCAIETVLTAQTVDSAKAASSLESLAYVADLCKAPSVAFRQAADDMQIFTKQEAVELSRALCADSCLLESVGLGTCSLSCWAAFHSPSCLSSASPFGGMVFTSQIVNGKSLLTLPQPDVDSKDGDSVNSSIFTVMEEKNVCLHSLSTQVLHNAVAVDVLQPPKGSGNVHQWRKCTPSSPSEGSFDWCSKSIRIVSDIPKEEKFRASKPLGLEWSSTLGSALQSIVPPADPVAIFMKRSLLSSQNALYRIAQSVFILETTLEKFPEKFHQFDLCGQCSLLLSELSSASQSPAFLSECVVKSFSAAVQDMSLSSIENIGMLGTGVAAGIELSDRLLHQSLSNTIDLCCAAPLDAPGAMSSAHERGVGNTANPAAVKEFVKLQGFTQKLTQNLLSVNYRLFQHPDDEQSHKLKRIQFALMSVLSRCCAFENTSAHVFAEIAASFSSAVKTAISSNVGQETDSKNSIFRGLRFACDSGITSHSGFALLFEPVVAFLSKPNEEVHESSSMPIQNDHQVLLSAGLAKLHSSDKWENLSPTDLDNRTKAGHSIVQDSMRALNHSSAQSSSSDSRGFLMLYRASLGFADSFTCSAVSKLHVGGSIHARSKAKESVRYISANDSFSGMTNAFSPMLRFSAAIPISEASCQAAVLLFHQVLTQAGSVTLHPLSGLSKQSVEVSPSQLCVLQRDYIIPAISSLAVSPLSTRPSILQTDALPLLVILRCLVSSSTTVQAIHSLCKEHAAARQDSVGQPNIVAPWQLKHHILQNFRCNYWFARFSPLAGNFARRFWVNCSVPVAVAASTLHHISSAIFASEDKAFVSKAGVHAILEHETHAWVLVSKIIHFAFEGMPARVPTGFAFLDKKSDDFGLLKEGHSHTNDGCGADVDMKRWRTCDNAVHAVSVESSLATVAYVARHTRIPPIQEFNALDAGLDSWAADSATEFSDSDQSSFEFASEPMETSQQQPSEDLKPLASIDAGWHLVLTFLLPSDGSDWFEFHFSGFPNPRKLHRSLFSLVSAAQGSDVMQSEQQLSQGVRDRWSRTTVINEGIGLAMNMSGVVDTVYHALTRSRSISVIRYCVSIIASIAEIEGGAGVRLLLFQANSDSSLPSVKENDVMDGEDTSVDIFAALSDVLRKTDDILAIRQCVRALAALLNPPPVSKVKPRTASIDESSRNPWRASGGAFGQWLDSFRQLESDRQDPVHSVQDHKIIWTLPALWKPASFALREALLLHTAPSNQDKILMPEPWETVEAVKDGIANCQSSILDIGVGWAEGHEDEDSAGWAVIPSTFTAGSNQGPKGLAPMQKLSVEQFMLIPDSTSLLLPLVVVNESSSFDLETVLHTLKAIDSLADFPDGKGRLQAEASLVPSLARLLSIDQDSLVQCTASIVSKIVVGLPAEAKAAIINVLANVVPRLVGLIQLPDEPTSSGALATASAIEETVPGGASSHISRASMVSGSVVEQLLLLSQWHDVDRTSRLASRTLSALTIVDAAKEQVFLIENAPELLFSALMDVRSDEATVQFVAQTIKNVCLNSECAKLLLRSSIFKSGRCIPLTTFRQIPAGTKAEDLPLPRQPSTNLTRRWSLIPCKGILALSSRCLFSGLQVLRQAWESDPSHPSLNLMVEESEDGVRIKTPIRFKAGASRATTPGSVTGGVNSMDDRPQSAKSAGSLASDELGMESVFESDGGAMMKYGLKAARIIRPIRKGDILTPATLSHRATALRNAVEAMFRMVVVGIPDGQDGLKDDAGEGEVVVDSDEVQQATKNYGIEDDVESDSGDFYGLDELGHNVALSLIASGSVDLVVELLSFYVAQSGGAKIQRVSAKTRLEKARGHSSSRGSQASESDATTSEVGNSAPPVSDADALDVSAINKVLLRKHPATLCTQALLPSRTVRQLVALLAKMSSTPYGQVVMLEHPVAVNALSALLGNSDRNVADLAYVALANLTTTAVGKRKVLFSALPAHARLLSSPSPNTRAKACKALAGLIVLPGGPEVLLGLPLVSLRGNGVSLDDTVKQEAPYTHLQPSDIGFQTVQDLLFMLRGPDARKAAQMLPFADRWGGWGDEEDGVVKAAASVLSRVMDVAAGARILISSFEVKVSPLQSSFPGGPGVNRGTTCFQRNGCEIEMNGFGVDWISNLFISGDDETLLHAAKIVNAISRFDDGIAAILMTRISHRLASLIDAASLIHYLPPVHVLNSARTAHSGGNVPGGPFSSGEKEGSYRSEAEGDSRPASSNSLGASTAARLHKVATASLNANAFAKRVDKSLHPLSQPHDPRITQVPLILLRTMYAVDTVANVISTWSGCRQWLDQPTIVRGVHRICRLVIALTDHISNQYAPFAANAGSKPATDTSLPQADQDSLWAYKTQLLHSAMRCCVHMVQGGGRDLGGDPALCSFGRAVAACELDKSRPSDVSKNEKSSVPFSPSNGKVHSSDKMAKSCAEALKTTAAAARVHVQTGSLIHNSLFSQSSSNLDAERWRSDAIQSLPLRLKPGATANGAAMADPSKFLKVGSNFRSPSTTVDWIWGAASAVVQGADNAHARRSLASLDLTNVKIFTIIMQAIEKALPSSQVWTYKQSIDWAEDIEDEIASPDPSRPSTSADINTQPHSETEENGMPGMKGQTFVPSNALVESIWQGSCALAAVKETCFLPCIYNAMASMTMYGPQFSGSSALACRAMQIVHTTPVTRSLLLSRHNWDQAVEISVHASLSALEVGAWESVDQLEAIPASPSNGSDHDPLLPSPQKQGKTSAVSTEVQGFFASATSKAIGSATKQKATRSRIRAETFRLSNASKKKESESQEFRDKNASEEKPPIGLKVRLPSREGNGSNSVHFPLSSPAMSPSRWSPVKWRLHQKGATATIESFAYHAGLEDVFFEILPGWDWSKEIQTRQAIKSALFDFTVATRSDDVVELLGVEHILASDHMKALQLLADIAVSGSAVAAACSIQALNGLSGGIAGANPPVPARPSQASSNAQAPPVKGQAESLGASAHGNAKRLAIAKPASPFRSPKPLAMPSSRLSTPNFASMSGQTPMIPESTAVVYPVDNEAPAISQDDLVEATAGAPWPIGPLGGAATWMESGTAEQRAMLAIRRLEIHAWGCSRAAMSSGIRLGPDVFDDHEGVPSGSEIATSPNTRKRLMTLQQLAEKHAQDTTHWGDVEDILEIIGMSGTGGYMDALRVAGGCAAGAKLLLTICLAQRKPSSQQISRRDPHVTGNTRVSDELSRPEQSLGQRDIDQTNRAPAADNFGQRYKPDILRQLNNLMHAADCLSLLCTAPSEGMAAISADTIAQICNSTTPSISAFLPESAIDVHKTKGFVSVAERTLSSIWNAQTSRTGVGVVLSSDSKQLSQRFALHAIKRWKGTWHSAWYSAQAAACMSPALNGVLPLSNTGADKCWGGGLPGTVSRVAYSIAGSGWPSSILSAFAGDEDKSDETKYTLQVLHEINTGPQSFNPSREPMLDFTGEDMIDLSSSLAHLVRHMTGLLPSVRTSIDETEHETGHKALFWQTPTNDSACLRRLPTDGLPMLCQLMAIVAARAESAVRDGTAQPAKQNDRPSSALSTVSEGTLQVLSSINDANEVTRPVRGLESLLSFCCMQSSALLSQDGFSAQNLFANNMNATAQILSLDTNENDDQTSISSINRPPKLQNVEGIPKQIVPLRLSGKLAQFSQNLLNQQLACYGQFATIICLNCLSDSSETCRQRLSEIVLPTLRPIPSNSSEQEDDCSAHSRPLTATKQLATAQTLHKFPSDTPRPSVPSGIKFVSAVSLISDTMYRDRRGLCEAAFRLLLSMCHSEACKPVLSAHAPELLPTMTRCIAQVTALASQTRARNSVAFVARADQEVHESLTLWSAAEHAWKDVRNHRAAQQDKTKIWPSFVADVCDDAPVVIGLLSFSQTVESLSQYLLFPETRDLAVDGDLNASLDLEEIRKEILDANLTEYENERKEQRAILERQGSLQAWEGDIGEKPTSKASERTSKFEFSAAPFDNGMTSARTAGSSHGVMTARSGISMATASSVESFVAGNAKALVGRENLVALWLANCASIFESPSHDNGGFVRFQFGSLAVTGSSGMLADDEGHQDVLAGGAGMGASTVRANAAEALLHDSAEADALQGTWEALDMEPTDGRDMCLSDCLIDIIFNSSKTFTVSHACRALGLLAYDESIRIRLMRTPGLLEILLVIACSAKLDIRSRAFNDAISDSHTSFSEDVSVPTSTVHTRLDHLDPMDPLLLARAVVHRLQQLEAERTTEDLIQWGSASARKRRRAAGSGDPDHLSRSDPRCSEFGAMVLRQVINIEEYISRVESLQKHKEMNRIKLF